MSDSLRPHGLYRPWDSPGQNNGVGSHSLLQGSFPIQRSNPGLPHCRRILYWLSHQGSPRIWDWVAYPFSSRSSRNWIGIELESPAVQADSLPAELWGKLSWLIGKDPDAGKDWGQEKGATEDEMVGWHHWLNGHVFEQTLGDIEGQGSLECYCPSGWKELDMT